MSGEVTTLALREESGGALAVGWPGAPGDTEYFTHQLATYANSTEATVPVLAHGAFGLSVASQLDVLANPARYITRTATGEAVETFPTRQIAPIATFFASPTQVAEIGTGTSLDVLRGLDPNATTDPVEKWRRLYALSASATLDAMARDATRDATPVAGFPALVAVAGVVVVVAGFVGWMHHLENVAEVEAEASVRRERELRAAATRDALERMRQTVAATPAGQPVDWSRMPPPTANENAAREPVQRAAESEWQRIARAASEGLGRAATGLSTAVMIGGALFIAYKIFNTRE